MASLPGRCCSTPGCRHQAERGSRCDACHRKRQQQQDERRPSPHARGYDAEHQRLRLLCFVRDGWKCVDCGWMPDTVRDSVKYELGDPPTEVVLHELRERWRNGLTHLHGDHDQPIQSRPDLRHDLDNYRTRCNECHSAKTLRELTRAT